MRRIQRDICHEEFIKSLTTGDSALFREIWRLLLFAAAVGIREGRRRPLRKAESGKAIPESYFSAAGWPGFLYLIGVADSCDSECLRNSNNAQESLVTAFEEYANEGLYALRERMQGASAPLDEVVSLMLEVVKPQTSTPIFEDLI